MASRDRLRQIVSVLGSYGFGHIYHTKIRSQNKKQDPVNLRKAFEELGPSFIKIGQILSTRRDLLPKSYIQELSKLQDAAPQFPFEQIQTIFKEDFGKDLMEVFDEIEQVPIASASVSQVHRGKLKNGEEVILKVQRPDIEKSLVEDINLFIRIVDKAPNIFKEFLVDPKEVFEEILSSSKRELDFRNEAMAMVKFKELNQRIACVGVPKPYLQYSSKRVIMQEYIDGIKIMDKKQLLAEGYDMEDVSKKLLLSFLSQIFRDGYFHGDPHPGNLMIKEGKIFFIDFGIMGELSPQHREALNGLLQALVFQDLDQVMNLLLSLGIQHGRIDQTHFYDDLSYLIDKYVTTNFSQLKIGTLIADMMEVTRKYRLSMPSDFTVMVRALTVLEGVLTDIYSEINIVGMAKEYLKESNEFSIIGPVSKEKILLSALKVSKDMVKLPSNLAVFLDHLNNGRTKIKIDIVNMDEKWIGLNKMVNRIVFALIISALILSSALIIFATEKTGTSIVGLSFFVGAGLLGLWLLISIIRSGRM